MIEKAQIRWKVPKGYKPTKSKSLTWDKLFKIFKVSWEDLWFHISAFIFGLASIKGLYPFGLSFVAAAGMNEKKYYTAAAFSLAGVIVGAGTTQATRYALAMLIFIALYKFLPEAMRHKDTPVAALTFASSALTGMVFILQRGISPYDLILLFMESSLSAIAVLVLPGGLPWIYSTRVSTAERAICFAIMAGVVLPIVSGIEVMGINLREVLGVLGVMIMALINGPGVGASTGVILGLIGFSSTISPWAMAVLAFSGLISGSFNKLGKLGVFAGFTLGYLLFNLYVNSLAEALIPFPTLFVSLALLLMLPASTQRSLKIALAQTPSELWEMRDLTHLGAAKLYEVSACLEELGKAYDGEGFGIDGDESAANYFDRNCGKVKTEICSGCHLTRVCWELEPRKTARQLYELVKGVEGGRNTGRIPEIFRTRCNYTEKIMKVVAKEAYAENLKRKTLEILKENRQLIKNHYRGAAAAMKELAMNLSDEDSSPLIQDLAKAKLSEMGVRVEQLQCREHLHHCTLSLIKGPCIGPRQCEEIIPQGLSQVLGEKIKLRIIDCPQRTGAPKCRLIAKTLGSLEVTVGVTGTAKEGGGVSGDGFSFMELDNGQYLLALSDGMGVGKKAQRHSEKTLSMVERLLEAGFDSQSALKIANTTLMASAVEEGFSTLDMAIIDTYTGQTRFIKSGAPSSFILRGQKILRVKGGSLPVGILNGICPQITEMKLAPGDTVIMVTDGIVDGLAPPQGGEEVLYKLIATLGQMEPQNMADEILKAAKEGGVKDDMTVMVAKIRERPKAS